MATPWGSRPAGSSASRADRPTPRAATSTFSRTLSPPNRCPCWKLRAMPARARRVAFQPVTSDPSTTTDPLSGRSKPVTQFTRVVLPAPFGPISPTTSRRPTSRSTSLSAWMPWNERETPAARRRLFTRRLLECHRLSRLHRPGEARLAILNLDHPVLAAERRMKLGGTADVPRARREPREPLGGVGELLAVGRAAVVLDRLHEAVDGGRAGDESARRGRLASLLHLGDQVAHRRIRIVAVHRGVGDHVDVVRDALALRQPEGAVDRPRTHYRRGVPTAAHPGDERRQILLGGRADGDRVGLRVVHAADDVVDRSVALGEALLARDLAAELLEPLLERLADVLGVDDRLVGDDVGRLPSLLVRELGQRRPLVLRHVSVAEREPPGVAEPLRPHLIGADAGRDGEQPRLDALLGRRSRPVDVAGNPHDVGALVDQIDGRGLRPRWVQPRVLDLELDVPAVHAALRVHLVGLDLRRRQRRPVEELHELRLIDCRADRDWALLGGGLSATAAAIVVIVVAAAGDP